MGKIVAGLFISVDGVVDAADGWQFPYFDAEIGAAMAAGARRARALLLGRRTYQENEAQRTVAPDSPVVALMDALPTYVVSTTLADGAQPGHAVIASEPVERIGELRARTDGDVLVLGSPTLVRWLLASGLLDELDLFVLPIVVGSGQRLFDASSAGRHPLALVSSQVMGNGALELRYAPTGPA